MVKDVKIYFIGLKKDLFGCFRIEEIREKDNATGLKEGRVIKIETTVLPYTRCTLSIRFVFTHVSKPSPLITTLVPPSSEPMFGTIDVIDMT